MSDPLSSHHIFIFPFKWDTNPFNDAFADRANLTRLVDSMEAKGACSLNELNGYQWKKFNFEIKTPKDYNEWGYFYAPVRDILFAKGANAEKMVRQYHIRKSDVLTLPKLQISLDPELKSKDFKLEIEEITLTFYETGVGFFGFHLNNYEYKTPEEILRINDFGRRIYPQFLAEGDKLTDASKQAFLPDSVSIILDEKPIQVDTFQRFESLEHGHDQIIEGFIPEYLRAFLPPFFKYSRTSIAAEDVLIESLIDDRMFVVCWAGNDEWAKGLNASNYTDASNELAVLWHRMVFVDGKYPGLANDKLLSALNESHTNDRWADYGTFYGITRYSFVALTDLGAGKSLVLPHVQTMYFQIALLCLLQRASVLRFSEEMVRLVGVSENHSYSEQAKFLYKKYLHFINKIYFREVSPNEQGIELYRLVQDKMEINNEIDRLKTEIDDFHQLMELENSSVQTKAMNILTIVGSGLLAPSLILAYFGISAFPELKEGYKEEFLAWASLIAATGSCFALLAALSWVKTWKNWAIVFLVLTIATFIWAINLPFWFPLQLSAPH